MNYEADEKVRQAILEAMLVEMDAICDYLLEHCCETEPSPYVVKQCPNCSGGAVEIYTIEPPCGYTGIYRCMECDSTFDPNFSELN